MINLFAKIRKRKYLCKTFIRNLKLKRYNNDDLFAVFLAEPVSDIIAAIVTTIVFMFKFNNILSENE